jgi:hypothetical protein
MNNLKIDYIYKKNIPRSSISFIIKIYFKITYTHHQYWYFICYIWLKFRFFNFSESQTSIFWEAKEVLKQLSVLTFRINLEKNEHPLSLFRAS